MAPYTAQNAFSVSVKDGLCRLDGCERSRGRVRKGDLCSAHYYRLRRGLPDWDAHLRAPRRILERCRLSGCERIVKDDGLCFTHLQRRVCGIPRWDEPCEAWCGSGRSYVAPGYDAAHQRVSARRGRANTHNCVECGHKAREWAYDGTDPDQIFGERRARSNDRPEKSSLFYSLDPSFYQPMCKSCHAKMDRAKAAQELYEYRLWKHKTGRTLANA